MLQDDIIKNETTSIKWYTSNTKVTNLYSDSYWGKLTFSKQRSFIASVTASEATYCSKGTTRPSSISIVNENIRQPGGDSQTFVVLPTHSILILVI